MPLPDSWAPIKEDVLRKIKPSERERKKLDAFLRRIVGGLDEALLESGVEASVEVHGSVSRDTWLVDTKDLDVFIIMDPSAGRGALRRVNDVVKGYVGAGWREAYAEHPYIVAKINSFDVEFIPGFRLKTGGRIVSAVDRSPLHTRFVKEGLSEAQHDDVRLLKCFMMGIGVYGAEMRVGGFSGYLCELLVLAFGSFEGVVDEATTWGEPRILQFGTKSDEVELRKKFDGPLIVVDPVDRNRNVASAVTETSFWYFVQACRMFTSVPDKKFFFHHSRPVEPEDVILLIEGRGTDLVFISVQDSDPPVPDTLWGLLFRTERGARRSLEDRGFRVIRTGVWSDESSAHVFVFELESERLPPVVRRSGPPVRFSADGADFLASYLVSEDTVSGPAIEGERWWVLTRRKGVAADTALREIMLSEADSPIPARISDKFRDGGRILVNGEVSSILVGGFTDWLHSWLIGRPVWLG